MATWGLHIRIAEELLKSTPNLDREKFLIGNIGADCGKPNDDWSVFTPPTKVTHWLDETSGKILTEEFYNQYLTKAISDNKRFSYLLGYYTHLLTDYLWRESVDKKKITDRHYAKLNDDPKFIWTIKKDWYDLDRLYFYNNPNSIFYTTFQHIKEFTEYLDYFPVDATISQIRYITEFYLKEKDGIHREYIYLNEREMDEFVAASVDILKDKLTLLNNVSLRV